MVMLQLQQVQMKHLFHFADDDCFSIMTTGSGSGGVWWCFKSGNMDHDGDAIFNLGGSPTGKTLTLDFGG